MDHIGGEGSYEGYPANLGFPLNCENRPKGRFNEDMVGKQSFDCWEGNLGTKCQLSNMNDGVHDSFLTDNSEMWNSIPCRDLLALADAATTTKPSQVNISTVTNSDTKSRSMLDSQQYGRPNKYLFDLNSPPITIPEPHISTYLSSQLTPVTPDQTKRIEEKKVAFDIVKSNKDGRTDQATDKQPQLIIEQSNATTSMQLEVNGDLKKGSTDDDDDDDDDDDEIILNKTPQLKQRRRKHRPKVVIEGQTKSAKKSTPKPGGSSTGKRNYVRKIETDKSKKTPASEETNEVVRQTRYSCRRKLNFDQDQKLYTQVEPTFSVNQVLESQSLCPITPNKTEGQEARGSKRERSNNENAMGIRRESLEAYLSMFTNYNNGSIPGLHFPAIYKKKRSEKCQSSVTSSVPASWYAIKAPETPKVYGVKDDRQSYKHMLPFGQVENFRKKRTKGLKRVRDLASFAGMIEGKKWSTPISYKRYTCMEALVADFGVSIATKKRTKRNYIVSSSLYHNRIGFNPGLRWKSIYDINALINQFEHLDIESRIVEKNRHAIIPYVTRYRERNALVLYQRDGTVVPFEGSDDLERARKPRPKVDLDEETSRVWRLLLENINNQGIDGTDEEKAKWWEEERNVFSGRAASFIARMHLVQGDRRFSRWKGSVIDSVIGVFLTQNVSDHLSSSAFMSLAARYPLKSKSGNEQFLEEKCQKDLDETITWHEKKSNQQPTQDHHADSYEEKEVDFLVFSQNSVDAYPNSIQSSVTRTVERSGSCSLSNSITELMDAPKATNLGGSTYEVYSLEQANELFNNKIGEYKLDSIGNSHEYIELREERRIIHKTREENCASEHSGISGESASQAPAQAIEAQKIVIDIENLSAEISEVAESNNIVENSREIGQKIVESISNENGNIQTTVSDMNEGRSKVKRGKTRKSKKMKPDWDSLRTSAQVKRKREKTPNTMDSLDYEAVRCADVNEIADTIKDRGMNNMLAERIKAFLNRLVREHGSIDLEWLRDVPPDKAKEYLLSFRGLGLKSVECVRLLTLHHLAFPVDTNVGRIAVRLGWVPLQPLPESLQLHLLELYPVLESIQKYLWPRLCKLDQRTLYELHYQMITFGKVFCTKSKPNCNACPMRGECRHFASAFASARLSLPAPEEKGIVSAIENRRPAQSQSPTGSTNHPHLSLPPPPANQHLQQQFEIKNHEPVIEEPATPEPIIEVPATPEPEKMQQGFDIEDFCEDPEEIPTIKLNIEEFTQNLQTYMENNMELAEGDVSKALVALTSEAASIPTPKLKNVSQLRTEHQVYELPDSHPLLEGLDKREPDDPCSYLLAIWTPGETAQSIRPPEGQCSSQESGTLCQKETCFLCNSIREANSQTVRGTLLIPCRTAMRGSFPLNGTYFQVNEVFADHDSSLNPIDVPRSWLWSLPRRTVYFGTSIPTIFKGLTTEGIQYCFWRGFVCVRGFDQKTRAPRPLMARLHFPASKLKRSKGERLTKVR